MAIMVHIHIQKLFIHILIHQNTIYKHTESVGDIQKFQLGLRGASPLTISHDK